MCLLILFLIIFNSLIFQLKLKDTLILCHYKFFFIKIEEYTYSQDLFVSSNWWETNLSLPLEKECVLGTCYYINMQLVLYYISSLLHTI